MMTGSLGSTNIGDVGSDVVARTNGWSCLVWPIAYATIPLLGINILSLARSPIISRWIPTSCRRPVRARTRWRAGDIKLQGAVTASWNYRMLEDGSRIRLQEPSSIDAHGVAELPLRTFPISHPIYRTHPPALRFGNNPPYP